MGRYRQGCGLRQRSLLTCQGIRTPGAGCSEAPRCMPWMPGCSLHLAYVAGSSTLSSPFSPYGRVAKLTLCHHLGPATLNLSCQVRGKASFMSVPGLPKGVWAARERDLRPDLRREQGETAWFTYLWSFSPGFRRNKKESVRMFMWEESLGPLGGI